MQTMKDLIRHLEVEEGFRRAAYKDHRGFLTVGHGICIDPAVPGAGLTEAESRLVVAFRVEQLADEIRRRWPGWARLDEPRRLVLVAMAYQLGVAGLLGFKNMLGALDRRDWLAAQREALDSDWYRQTPARAGRLAHMLAMG